MASIPTDFFTPGSMLTLFGGASAVLVVSNTFQSLLKRDPKWVAFILSVLLSIAGTLAAVANRKPPDTTDFQLVDGVVAFINGCLIFCTATGINAAAGKPVQGSVAQGGTTTVLSAVKNTPQPGARDWRSRWF